VAQVIYALLAGINDYQGRVNSLSGCADDIRGFQDFLEGRVDQEHLRILPLVNQDATRENIINGFGTAVTNSSSAILLSDASRSNSTANPLLTGISRVNNHGLDPRRAAGETPSIDSRGRPEPCECGRRDRSGATLRRGCE